MINFRQRWSRYLLYFILAVLPLERIPSLSLVHPLHATIRLSQVAGVILILLNIPLLWRKRGQVIHKPWVFLAAFLLIALVSVGLSQHHLRSSSVWAFTAFDILLAWTVSLVFERDKLGSYAKIVIYSAVVVCLFGLYQFFGDLFGLPTSLTGLRAMYTSKVFGFPRIQSTGLEPLYFSDYLLLPAGWLILAILYRRWRWAWAPLAFILTILFEGESRGAIAALIGMVVLGLIWAVWQRAWRPASILVASTIAGAVLAFGLIAGGSSLATRRNANTNKAVSNFSHHVVDVTNGESAVGRTITRGLAVNAAKAHPFFGLGPGAFGYYAHQKMPQKFGDNSAIVNNEPLEILAETGTLGLAVFIGFVVSLIVLAWRRWRSLDTTAQWFAGGLVLALIGIAAQYQTFSTLYITHIWVAIGLLIATLGLSQAKPT